MTQTWTDALRREVDGRSTSRQHVFYKATLDSGDLRPGAAIASRIHASRRVAVSAPVSRLGLRRAAAQPHGCHYTKSTYRYLTHA